MHPLSGRIYLSGDSKLNAINVGIQLHDGEDAAIINLDIVAQLEPIAVPDFLVHRLRAAIAANWYPDLAEAIQSGRLRCDTNLTLEQATQQWADLGLTIDAMNMDIEAALARNTEVVTVAAAQTQGDMLADMQRQIADMQAKLASPIAAPPAIDQADVIAAQADMLAAQDAEIAALKALVQGKVELASLPLIPLPTTTSPKTTRQPVVL